MEFEVWLGRVDGLVGEVYGESIYDLPELPYKEWFDKGVPVTEAAAWVIEASV